MNNPEGRGVVRGEFVNHNTTFLFGITENTWVLWNERHTLATGLSRRLIYYLNATCCSEEKEDPTVTQTCSDL